MTGTAVLELLEECNRMRTAFVKLEDHLMRVRLVVLELAEALDRTGGDRRLLARALDVLETKP